MNLLHKTEELLRFENELFFAITLKVALIYSRVNYIFLQGDLNSTTSVGSGTFARRSNTLKHKFTPQTEELSRVENELFLQ